MNPIRNAITTGTSDIPDAASTPLPQATELEIRWRRQGRINLAWGTSLISKCATIGVQVMAVPLVYRALGDGGYAAYASVTASTGLIVALNLGIGGSLVTPLAQAVAGNDKRRQAVLVQAGLKPLMLMCIAGGLLLFPVVAFLPLKMLLGNAGMQASRDLRIAALIAMFAALATVPLSAVGFLRQAYQEIHITNLLGAASNLILWAALWMAALRSTSVAVFVAAFTLIPVAANAVNFGQLLWKRRFLLHVPGGVPWKEGRPLLTDGLRYLGASCTNVLIYQWPVYWMARTMAPAQSALFAVCVQAVILPLGFVNGFLQPLWSSAADAFARGDRAWLARQISRGRAAILTIGGVAFLSIFVFGERIIHFWIRKPVTLDWQLRGLIGAYILLGIWENFHFVMALGLGRLRKATAAQFQRSIAFALVVPILTGIGGPRALWAGLCVSILLWTAWRLPCLLPKVSKS